MRCRLATAKRRPGLRPRRFWRQAPFEQAFIITAVIAVFGGCFVSSYGLALGRPAPHHSPTDLVGRPATARALVKRLEQLTGAGIDLRPVADVAAAKRDMLQQRVYATLVTGGRPRLLVASAAGASVSRLLQQAATQVQGGSRSLTVIDVRPLPREDPDGLVVFYASLAATIMGFMAMFQLRKHASGLTLAQWGAFIVLIACLNGITIAVTSGPVIGSLGGSLLEKTGILTLESAVAATVSSLLLIVLGRWAIVANGLLFIVLGNTSSGGAVAPPLLPPLYAALSRWLPPGACVEAMRNAVYFSSAQHPQPFLVLATWLTGATTGIVTMSRWLDRLPTGKRHTMLSPAASR